MLIYACIPHTVILCVFLSSFFFDLICFGRGVGQFIVVFMSRRDETFEIEIFRSNIVCNNVAKNKITFNLFMIEKDDYFELDSRQKLNNESNFCLFLFHFFDM